MHLPFMAVEVEFDHPAQSIDNSRKVHPLDNEQ